MDSPGLPVTFNTSICVFPLSLPRKNKASPLRRSQNRRKADEVMRKFTHPIHALLFLLWPGVAVTGQSVTVTNPSACGLNIPLSDNNCPENNPNIFFPDEIGIQVSGVAGTALGTDVYLKEVRLILSHTWMSDVRITLSSPGGITVLLTQDNGGSGDNLGNPATPGCAQYAVFSAGACTSITQGTPPYIDRPYLPMQSLLAFNDSLTNPNGLWMLRICDDVPNDVGVLQFVELVFEPVSCLPIAEKSVLGADTTTVVLHWSPAGDCSNVVIEYGPPGFEPGSGFDAGEGQVTIASICPPYPLEDLLPDTDYDIYIRRFCPGGGFSGNNCPLTVRTGCRPPPTTIIETFDAAAPCFPNCAAVCHITGFWRNAGGDDFDWLIYQGATPTPNTGPVAGVGGGGRYAYIETSGSLCNNGRRAILESNCVRLRKFGADACHLSFYYHMFGANINTLRLQVSQDGGFTWTTLWQRSGSQGNEWRKAYIGLGAYPEGAVLKFRFEGLGGNGSLGDIALDRIVFHGSEDLGAGAYTYYVDNDGDGYGRSDMVVQSCSPSAPPGFAAQGGDCNDANPNINPARPEIPCNGIDENCNGPADDNHLPAPAATGAVICSGQTAQLCAQAAFGGFLLWYRSPEGDDDFVDFGACITPAVPPNLSPVPVTHHFYVEEFAPPCISSVRRQVAVVVNPVPDAAPVAPVSVCPGQPLNLAEIPIVDNRFTGGTISFHSASPASGGNVLPSSVVNPTQNTTYHFRITGPGGCSDEGAIGVSMRPSPALSFTPADSFSLCKEGSQLVTAVAAGGTGGFSFFWSTGSQASSITVSAGASAGDLDAYQVTVTDAAGCTANGRVLVRTTNSIDSLQRAITHVSSCGANDGQIALNPLNGLPPFNYVWTSNNGISGGAFGIAGPYAIAGLPQGTYRVTVTDSSNPPCPFVLRQIFVNGPDAVVNPPIVVPVSCRDAADGAVCISAFGSNLQYLWNTGATTPCINQLAGGVYSVTISSGVCQTSLNDITVPEPDTLRVISSTLPPLCAASSNGSIELAVFGGTPPYQYLWSTGATSRNVHGLPAGDYSVTVTDARNCQRVEHVALTAPPPLSLLVDSLRAPACFGANDGFIRITGQGGTGSYQYAWSTGAGSPVLFGASAGSYTATVTDVNGCQAFVGIVLDQPQALNLNAFAVNHPECFGNDDGSILVGGSGGTAPYSFQWSNGIEGTVVNNLGAGIYTVTFTDARQCGPIVRQFELTPLSVLQLAINRTEPSCVGRNDGSIALQPSGTGPFAFFWPDNGSSSPLRTSIGVGDYAVLITDGRGCMYDTLIPLNAPQVFNVQKNILPPACYNGLDGIIDLTLLQAGQFPYAFQWSNGSAAEDLIGVPAGQYTVTITDALGCRYVSAPAVVPNPDPLHMEVVGLGPVLCHGDSSGYIEVSVNGGTPPYSNPSLYGIPAGFYVLQATDARSCPVNISVNLPAPPPLSVHVSLMQSGDCDTAPMTRLQAVVAGGIPPYRYLWNNGDTTALILNAAPGDYALTVTDANGCVRSVSAIKVREQIAPLGIASFTPSNVTCFGAQNGSLTVRLSGGSALYRYHFSTNQIITTSSDSVQLAGLGPGSNYRVTVTDINTGCVKIAGPVSIAQPQPLSFFRTSITDVVCFGSLTGAVQAATQGGTPPYQYRWTDASGAMVGEQEDLIMVGAGLYSGTATDARGCTAVLSGQLIRHLYDPISLIDSAFLMSPGVCSGANSGFIHLVVMGGAPPYQYTWSNGASGASVNGLPAGEYFATVTDNAQCTAVFGPFALSESPAVMVGINATPPDSTGSNGAVSAVVMGGTPPFTYFWSTGDNTPSVQPLGPGAYFLTVTDAAGCTGAASAVLVRISEREQMAAVRLYPNPGPGLFFLEFESTGMGVEGVLVRSVEGRVAYRMALTGAASSRETLDLGALPPGMYLLELLARGRPVFRQGFVILR